MTDQPTLKNYEVTFIHADQGHRLAVLRIKAKTLTLAEVAARGDFESDNPQYSDSYMIQSIHQFMG